jgi:DNA (cytosine-5)-methyltransferase 1
LLRATDGPASLFVGYSEIDKYAISVYERNFNGDTKNRLNQTRVESDNEMGSIQPTGDSSNNNISDGNGGWTRSVNNNERVQNYGDITKINAEELPDFDCIVGGFPCQAFSIAGKRKGFEDTRGTLFFDLARILRAKQPRLFVFENVKGLLSHDGGQTFKTIISTLTELGYDLQWQVLNSKNFGVPQNRERVFIVGHLRGTPRPEVFPIRESNGNHLEEITTKPAKSQKALGGGMGAKTGLYAVPVVTPDRVNKRQNGRRMKTNGEPAFTVTSQDRHGIFDGVKIRRLTPLECERLQGFPDNWTKYGADGNVISDTQRYKMCGNAVTTNVVSAIFERIIKSEEKLIPKKEPALNHNRTLLARDYIALDSRT